MIRLCLCRKWHRWVAGSGEAGKPRSYLKWVQGSNRTDNLGEEMRLKPRQILRWEGDRTGEWESRGEARAAVLSQAAGLAKLPWLIQRIG